ncbi:MAG: hypothetical protein C5B49_14635 [Bdellovibrio sp.]|nr:MAG: hypothetical protein C5B49_14635 [Bdellovibrio sp.]
MWFSASMPRTTSAGSFSVLPLRWILKFVPSMKTDTQSGQISRYNYDLLGNLKRVTFGTADRTERTIEYLVDGQNRRVGKKVDGVLVEQYVYQSALQIVAVLDKQGSLVSRFVYGSKINVPDYMLKDGQTLEKIAYDMGDGLAKIPWFFIHHKNAFTGES